MVEQENNKIYSKVTYFRNGSRFWYAYNLLENNLTTILDYGCFDGKFLNGLRGLVPIRIGVDRNEKQINLNKANYSDASFSCIDGLSIDFPGNYFDAATCLEVMEHVPSEIDLTKELFRVLKPNATLVISVPHKGMLGFLDTGNIKFNFPELVKFYFLYLKRDRETYENRYIKNVHGMIGDVSLSNEMRHKHYDIHNLESILSPYFEIQEVKYYGFFTPIIDMFKIIFCLICRLEFLRPMFEYIDDIDKRFSYGRINYAN